MATHVVALEFSETTHAEIRKLQFAEGLDELGPLVGRALAVYALVRQIEADGGQIFAHFALQEPQLLDLSPPKEGG